jgi:hypothetical protein
MGSAHPRVELMFVESPVFCMLLFVTSIDAHPPLYTNNLFTTAEGAAASGIAK